MVDPGRAVNHERSRDDALQPMAMDVLRSIGLSGRCLDSLSSPLAGDTRSKRRYDCHVD